jgi:hypothetical protein
VIYFLAVLQSGTNPAKILRRNPVTNPYFRGACLTAIICAIAPLSNAGTVQFSFSGGGITSSGTLTVVLAPANTSGVSTPNTYEITGISGTFADTNDGVSGSITGLYTPISYATPLTATSAAFTGAGLSYDDLFFAGADSPDDCPGYPFGGGYFDVYGVAFNLSDGDVGEFFSNGILPGDPNALYAAADASSTAILDEPNAGSTTEPNGVLGSFTSTPEPTTLLMLSGGVALIAMIRFCRRSRAQALN